MYLFSVQFFFGVPKHKQSGAVYNYQRYEKQSSTPAIISQMVWLAERITCLLEVLWIISVGLKSLSVSCSDLYISDDVGEELYRFDLADAGQR